MGTYTRPTKPSSGTTEFSDNTTASAAEVNDDINPLYTALAGGLDTDNISSLPWTKVTGTKNPEDIDDTSATQAEHDTTEDPGDVSSPESSATGRDLPENVQDEIRQLRYAVGRLAIGSGVVRYDTGDAANVNASWIEHPVRGRNLCVNGQFNIYTGTDPEAPDGWDLVLTPTVCVAAYNATVADGEGMELHLSGTVGEGISQTIGELKASTRYLLRVVGRTVGAADVINITTTGADGAVYSDAALTLTDETGNETVSTIVVTDATPADIVLSITAAATDEWYLSSVEFIELQEDPPSVQPEGYTTQAILSTETALTGSFANIAGLAVSVICPGPGYEIVAWSHVQGQAATANNIWCTGIAEGGTLKVQTASTLSDQTNRRSSQSCMYVNESPTAGTTYAYTVQGISSGTLNVAENQGGAYGQHTCSLTVQVRRRG